MALIVCFDCHRPLRRSRPLWMFGHPYGPKCGARYGLRHEKPVRARRPRRGSRPVAEQLPLFHLPTPDDEETEECE